MIASAHQLLESAYTELNLNEGDLLGSDVSVEAINLENWVEKSDWLDLARQVGAEKVFFVKNNPVIVFAKSDSQDDEQVRKIFNKVWCMARPNYLFLAKEGELAVYDLTKAPAKNTKEWKKNKPLAVARDIAEITSCLYKYKREQIESGKLFEDERFDNERADQSLIKDLKTVRSVLVKKGLAGDKLKYAHSLIGRSIFIRYLEDRGILTKKYFEVIAEQNPTWQALLNAPGALANMESEAKQHYFKVLSNKDFTYALFEKLSQDFNGDMFPSDLEEKSFIYQEHLDELKQFLKGDVDEQKKLFFWAYKFNIIPISLISSIYEEFYQESNEGETDNGTHYTPGSLVEFVLSKVLLEKSTFEKNPRILDPCCGSGIFLVEAFRRIVRYRVHQNHGQRLTSQELREILKKQIAGIEINPEAIRITAFSLYLALLNYQEPPDILVQIEQGECLPNLIYQQNSSIDDYHFNNLVCANAFKDFSKSQGSNLGQLFGSQCADIVVGNPPWGSPEGKDQKGSQELNIAIKWCEEHDYPVGDRERSQAFIWRTFDFLKDNGWSSLLVSTGIFLKTHEKSKAFRRKWLSSVLLKEVVNFAHVRDIFFKSKSRSKEQSNTANQTKPSSSAIAPFASIVFQKIEQELITKDEILIYWSAKKTAIIKDIQAVILSVSDRRVIRQVDLLSDDTLFKIYWWGSHRDVALIKAIEFSDRLSNIYDVSQSGQGFSTSKKDSKDSPAWFLTYQKLPTKNFQSYGKTKRQSLESPPYKVYRAAKETLYKETRLLIKHGIDQASRKKGEIVARLESDSFSFTNSFNCIKLQQPEEWKYKIILGILWSSLPRYYFFLTSSKWGIWHDGIYKDEYLSLPIILPTDISVHEQIINIVDTLQNWNPDDYILIKTQEQIDAELAELEYQLDEVIFDLYQLTVSERDLIRDMCEVGIELYYNHINSQALQSVENFPEENQGLMEDIPKSRQEQKGLEGYLQAFLEVWNRELEPDGEFSWQIIRANSSSSANLNPMLAVIFSTQEYGVQPQEQREWQEILDQLASKENGLLVPYNSHQIYLDGMVRYISDTDIIIIKRNEQRLWTRSMAREDAEATMLKLINLQEFQEET